MTINLGILMDPIGDINIKKDSSFAMMLAAQKKGWNVFYIEMPDLFLEQGLARARVRRLSVVRDQNKWFEFLTDETVDLNELDIILMRVDPPVDAEFIYATHILERAANQGVLVVNRPQSLRDCNEKVFATRFPELCPPNLISSNISDLKNFYHRYGDVIVKPLDGMGGKGVFHLVPDELNVNAILEMLTGTGTIPIMMQVFIPEISAGDKRILLLHGEPIPWALARIPAGDDKVRGNLAAGGLGKVVPLQERDYFICNYLANTLKKQGMS